MRNHLLKTQAHPALCSASFHANVNVGVATAGWIEKDIHYRKEWNILIFLSIVETGNTISLPIQYERRT